MKKLISVVIVFMVFSFFSFTTENGKHYSVKTIVIDAGHGGHDSGCLGSSSKEKEVALAISLKLGKFIEENFKDIKVIYTRKTDVFLELHERAAIANNNKADLFICIHCNSGPKDAFGTETYVMGLHRTESNLNVAKRENASILMENDYKAKYDGFDPNSPEANIIFTLYQNAFLEQSLALSSHIQTQFKEKLGRYSRGVKQAGFLVLYKTTMPSILIETGFLTHPVEEKFLASDEGQDKIAEGIYRAFRVYKGEVETNSKGKEDKEVVKEKEKEKEKEGTEEKKENPGEKEPEKPKEVFKKVKKDSVGTKEIVKKEDKPADFPKKTTYEKKKKKPVSDTLKVKVDKPADVDKSAESPNIIFKVQLGSAPKKEDLEGKLFKKLKDTKIEKLDNGMYYCYYGNTADFKEIVEKQTEARKKGIKEAFVVAFNNGKRIAVNEALSLLKKK